MEYTTGFRFRPTNSELLHHLFSFVTCGNPEGLIAVADDIFSGVQKPSEIFHGNGEGSAETCCYFFTERKKGSSPCSCARLKGRWVAQDEGNGTPILDDYGKFVIGYKKTFFWCHQDQWVLKVCRLSDSVLRGAMLIHNDSLVCRQKKRS